MHSAESSIATNAGCERECFALSRPQLILKRALDLFLTVPLLALCVPIYFVVAICVRISSSGPVIFRQSRIGCGGHAFALFKFRSMIVATDEAHREYTRRWIHAGEDARQKDGVFKLEADARITGVGHFLRKYSLDELPQLLNVLRGEMSLVGPRPAMSYEVANYEPWQCARLNVPPGLTGLAQVSGRNLLSFTNMVELDLEYIRRWSMWNEIRILLRTIPVVMHGTGH
jgi:lipopolysaccharide/colanic/teichoic acid biosynthesis glycosyltransferase